MPDRTAVAALFRTAGCAVALAAALLAIGPDVNRTAFSPGIPEAHAQGSGVMRSTTRAIERAIQSQVRRALEPTLAVRNAYDAPPRGLSLARDGRMMTIVTGDGGFRVFDLGTGQQMVQQDPQASPYTDVRVSGVGGVVAGLRADGRVTLARGWNNLPGTLLPGRNGVGATAVAVSGSHVVVGYADGTVASWDGRTGDRLRTHPATGAAVVNLVPGAGGGIVAGHRDGAIRALAPDGTARPLGSFAGTAITALAHDAGLLAVGTGDGRIRVMDADSGRHRAAWTAHNGAVTALERRGDRIVSAGADGSLGHWGLDGDARRTLSVNGDGGATGIALAGADGTSRILVAGPGKAVQIVDPAGDGALARLYTTRRGWGIVDRRGRFDGDPTAFEDMAWATSRLRLPVENLSERYFEPGLLVKHLTATAQFLTRADDAVADGIYAPPEVAIEVLARPTASTGEIRVAVRAETPSPSQVTGIRLFHNGKRVPESAVVGRSRDADDGGRRLVLRFAFPATPGENALRAVARGWADIDSEPVQVTVTAPESAAPPRLRLTAVGLDHYRGADLRLNYAVADAKAVAETFGRLAQPLFDRVESRLLLDADADRAAIRQLLAGLQATRPQDVALVFLSGHARTVGDRWYFLPHELRDLRDPDHVETVGISGATLAEALMAIPAQRVMLVIDTCQAGAILGRFDSFGQRRALHDLKRRTGVVVIAATRADQQAPEYRMLGHGLLTYTLLRGATPTEGRFLADHDPADGRLTARELKSFVEATVPELALVLEERLAERTGQRGAFVDRVPVTPVGLAWGGDFVVGRP